MNTNERDALVAQLRSELSHDKGWDYTEYERGRIAEKERCISLLEALAAPAEGWRVRKAGDVSPHSDVVLLADMSSPLAASVELVEVVRELRRCQRDYLSQPKGERIEAKGRLVGLAADRVDAALALIDSAGGAGCRCGLVWSCKACKENAERFNS